MDHNSLQAVLKHGLSVYAETWAVSLCWNMGCQSMLKHGLSVYAETWAGSLCWNMGWQSMLKHGLSVYAETWAGSLCWNMGWQSMLKHGLAVYAETWAGSLCWNMGWQSMLKHGLAVYAETWAGSLCWNMGWQSMLNYGLAGLVVLWETTASCNPAADGLMWDGIWFFNHFTIFNTKYCVLSCGVLPAIINDVVRSGWIQPQFKCVFGGITFPYADVPHVVQIIFHRIKAPTWHHKVPGHRQQ